MNPLVLYFASGDSLYLGAGLIVGAVVTSQYTLNKGLMILRSLATWLGLAMIMMACPPFSWVVDAIFAAVFFCWLIASNRTRAGAGTKKLGIAVTAVLVGLTVILPVLELFRRQMPAINGAPGDHLVIVGDSISSGIDPSVPAWPELLQRQTGIPVRNLSRPGADVTEARTMADEVAPQDTVVLIEIGGNDLLSGVPPSEFSHGLESLLSKLTLHGRTLVMFELPLLPHRIAYGQIQRHLAMKYGAFLIPRHYFTNVLTGADATSDGLHLSQLGAHRMAALVAQALLPVLKSAARNPEPANP